jgi:(1->4)-alpha-D-glucan 1-alpha-D-glucosylmutase
MREAKTRTSWTAVDSDYESAVIGFAAQVLHDDQLRGQIGDFVAGLADLSSVNALGAKLVQLTMPGVADLFQGCELEGLALVDPDNRRPVDFARRRELLAALDGGGAGGGLDADKLRVTVAALRLRRAHPAWFAGDYQPLPAVGPAASHVVSFRRGSAAASGAAVTVATRLPASLLRRGGWGDTALPLMGGAWRDVLTGTVHDGKRPLLANLTERFPVALLEPV